MHYNFAQMGQLRASMSGSQFEHEIVAGDILHSYLRYEDGTQTDHVMFSHHKTNSRVWHGEVVLNKVDRKFGGEIWLPNHYLPRQTAAFFDTVCAAMWDEDYDKLWLMLNAVVPDNKYETDLLRLSQMCYIPGWNTRCVEEGSIEDWPGIRFESAAMKRAHNLAVNSPEEGLAHWTTLDWGNHEIDYMVMPWSYETDDVIAVNQVVYAMLAQKDKVLSDRLA